MIPFLLKASIVLAILLLFYKYLLAKETFFKVHRMYLLGGLILAFSLPLLQLPELIQEQGLVSEWIEAHVVSEEKPTGASTELALKENEKLENNATVIDSDVQVSTDESTSELKENASPLTAANEADTSIKPAKARGLWFWIISIYWFGVIVFAIRFIAQFIGTIYQVIKSDDKIIDEDNVIVNMSSESEPCSFFHYIFINPQSYDYDTYEQILAHERIHVRQRHTIDLLLTELALIILWFNPLVWLYRKEVEKNIEYQTDALLVQEETVEKEQYQINLVKVATFNQPLSITTNYNQSLIKQRILKMNAKKSNLYSYWKYAFIAPLLIAVLLVLNKPVNAIAKNAVVEMESLTINEEAPAPMKKQTTPESKVEKVIENIPIEVERKELNPEDSDCKKLIHAVYDEDVALVKSLLKTVDPNCIDPNPDKIITKKANSVWQLEKAKSALVVAADKGNLEIAKILVDAGADVNLHAKWDEAPLMGAAGSGNLELVKYLKDKGADVNKAQAHMGTALMAASREGHASIMEYLINQDAKVNRSVAHVGTPLILAAREGHLKAVEFLISKNAELDKSVAHVGTPLMLAAGGGHLEVVSLLIKKGASLDKHVAHVGTPLIKAAAADEKELMNYLLENGADVNKHVAHVGTPLLIAAREGKVDMVNALISKNADIDLHVAHVGSPLLVAAREGEEKVVELLLSKGADVNKHVAHVGSPLLVAAREGHKSIMKTLLNNGADIDKQVAHVGTPLLIAAREGNMSIAKFLVENGADLDKQVAHVGTPLVAAAREGEMKMVKYLIDKGADVNKSVQHVGSPLSAASNSKHKDVVELLISKGAR